MSYILDALKKSEEKRGTHAQPSAQVVMPSERPSGLRRIALPLLIALLAAVAGWLVAQWQVVDTDALSLANQATEKPVFTQSPVVLEDTMLADVSVDQVVEIDTGSKPAVARQIRLSSVRPAKHNAAAVRHVQQSRPLFTPVTPSSVLSTADISVLDQPTDQPQAVDTATVKSIFELSSDQQQAIPKIKIEAHLYDLEPRSRMVIINGKIRREKQTIVAGLVLQEITPDGVLLNYQGIVYHMGVFD